MCFEIPSGAAVHQRSNRAALSGSAEGTLRPKLAMNPIDRAATAPQKQADDLNLKMMTREWPG